LYINTGYLISKNQNQTELKMNKV
jgi:hypothetical protein